MVKDLGLVETCAAIDTIKYRAHQGRVKHKGGRPPTITDRQIRACTELWLLRVNPESVHPVRHIVQTAQYLNLPAVSIWKYLEEIAGDAFVPVEAASCNEFPWIKYMFPKWAASEMRHDGQ